MIKIAIVDDEESCRKQLLKLLSDYKDRNNSNFIVTSYQSGDEFLDSLSSERKDVVFMDVRMSGLDGFETCRKLRMIDKEVIIIFLTNLSQYAINGYEFGALDYLLKPISYESLERVLKRVLPLTEERNKDYSLPIKIRQSIKFLKVKEIIYIEARGHKCTFYMKDGTSYISYVPLNYIENKLLEEKVDCFGKCHNSFLVNLAYVQQVKGYDLYLFSDLRLPISQLKKKDFMDELSRYMSKGL